MAPIAQVDPSPSSGSGSGATHRLAGLLRRPSQLVHSHSYSHPSPSKSNKSPPPRPRKDPGRPRYADHRHSTAPSSSSPSVALGDRAGGGGLAMSLAVVGTQKYSSRSTSDLVVVARDRLGSNGPSTYRPYAGRHRDRDDDDDDADEASVHASSSDEMGQSEDVNADYDTRPTTDASASSDDSSPKSSSEPQMQPSPSRRALPLEPLGSHNLTTPATSDPASASSGSGTVRPAKGRRSQASLRSIPETFQQPPAPLPRLPKTNLTGLATAGGPAQAREPRTTSSTGSRRPSEEVGSGSAEDARDSHAGSSSRHSVGSQYASSSSAWTPSSLWGSRTGREGSLRAGSAARNSMASRDSHYTADTDYDEYFSPKSTAAQLQTRSPPPPRLPSLPPARPLDSDPLSLPSASARRRSHVESVPAVLPPKPEWHHSEAEPGPSAIGLGITADEAIGAGKSARSASVSSVPLRRPSTATTIEPGPGPSTVATRFSRVATLEETPSAQVTAPPSVHGHSNDEEIERSRADDFAARLAEAGQALGKWGADDGLRSKQRRRSSSDESSVLGKAVRTAEAGQGRIVDWSKMHCALEEVEVFPDTTHLLLPESRSPFVVNRLLQDCLPNIAARLLVLDISSASLTSIPLEIAACSALEELDVSGNSMRDCVLPRHLAQLRSLRVLAANDCDLFDLPHSLAPLTNLRDLSLRDNHLTALPLWLCHLTNLEVLLVDNNKFVAPWDGLVQPLLRHPNPDRPTPSADPSPPMSASSDGSGVDPSFAAAVRMAQQQSRTGDAKSNRLQIDLAVPPNSKYGLGDVPAPGAASAEAMRRMRSTPDFKGPSRSRTVSGMTHRSAVSKSVFSELSEATVLPTPMERAETMARVGKGLPPAPASEPKKPKGFFKKMSFGKLMKESRSRAPSVVEEVPVIPEPDVASSEAVRRPRLESMSTMNTSVRPLTTASSMLDDESLTSSGLRRSMARRRSFLCLDADWLMTAPIDLDTISSQPSTACATPSVESPVSASTASAIVDARAALRSIIMYTRDVNDLCLNIDASRRPSQKGASRAPGARRMSDAFANGGVVPSPAHTPGPFENGSSGYVNETGPRKIVDDPLRRRRVLEEIAATEQSYIRGLQELQEIYIQPAAAVLSGLGKDKDSVVPVAERRRVFSNVEAIIDFHVGVLFPNIQQAMDPLSTPVEVDEDAGSVSIRDGHRLIRAAEEVSRVFIRHAAFLKLYSTYITQFDGALDRLQEWTQPGPNASSGSASPSISSAMSSPSPKGTALTPAQKKKLASYLKHARRHANHGQINLESYLLLPVQRLPRYKLLLENLVSCTPGTFPGEENHLVAEALKIIATITATLNEQKRSSEGRQRLLYWQGRLGNRYKSPLVQPHRTLEKEGSLTLVRTVKIAPASSNGGTRVPSLLTEPQSEPMVVLLCTDLLVLCKESADGLSPSSNASVQLHQALRIPQPHRGGAHRLPASVFGADQSMIRFVDQRNIVYLRCASPKEAVEWQNAINSQVQIAP